MYKKRKSSSSVTNGKRQLQTEFFDDYDNDESFNDYYDDEISEESDEVLLIEDEETERERKLLVHQRDDPNSLYLRFNIKQGNDRQWSAAIAMLRKLNVFNMQSIVENRIKIERSVCFQRDSDTNEFLHRYCYSITIIITPTYFEIIAGKKNGRNVH